MKPGGTTTIIRRHPKRARTGARAKKSKSTKTISPPGINTVPVEVLTEIFKNAHPADLISLSRTSKSFRNILMKPSAEPIWRCAESNVPGLPSYPWADISRPRYAALMFTKNCTECGKYTATNADPFLLVRLCQDCRNSALIPVGDRRFRTGVLNSLVLKTDRIKFSHPDRDSDYDRHVYSLATEVAQVEAMVVPFSQARSLDEFRHWKQDLREEVGLRQQFGAQVAKYIDDISDKNSQELEVVKRKRMSEIENKLRELGWTDQELNFGESSDCGKWLVLVKRVRPVTEETWSALLPKLTPLLEANRARIKKLDSTKRREMHIANIHLYLDAFRLEHHPLANFIKALNFGHLLEQDATPNRPTSTPVSIFLDRYPFPDTPTVLSWPFINKLVDTNKNVGPTATFARLSKLEGDIDAEVTEFIESIDDSFVLRLIPESAADAAKYRAQRMTPPLGTGDLHQNTQILLRADALFANAGIHQEDPERPQEFYYYTDCLRPRGDQNARIRLSGRAVRYCRYEKAEEVARALLECIGMPNASYLELGILGSVFVCERCSSLELMDWKGILKHYLDELHIWSALSAFKSHPKFRPRCPVYMTNVPKLDDLLDSDGDCLPLISLLDEDSVHFQLSLMDEEKDMDSWYCAPCRNYGRRYVSQGLVSFHMWNCHHVREVDTTEGVHYFLLEDAISFLERGGAWAESWDAHHKGLEEDLEVDDLEFPWAGYSTIISSCVSAMVTTRSGTQIVPEEPPEPKSVERKRNVATDKPKPPKRPRASLKYKKEHGENDFAMCKFTEVPVETFTEVCSYLHPADLIALARTCKVFRDILMKSSAEHIWYRAEDGVPNLPSYPWSNMSPPQYAALLFTRNCTTCGENTTSNADPFLLVRLCAVCRETELVEVAGRDHYLKEPMKLVCKTTMMHFRRKNAKKRPRGSGLLKYCLRNELEQLEATFKALSEPGCAAALARWKKEVHDEVKLRHEFGDKLHAFSHNNDVIRSRELAKIRRERTLAIEEKLLDLGWAEADLSFKWPNHQKWAALVEQPRPLTDRVWANLFPKLLPLLETNRAEQEQRETRSRKDVRQNQVHKLLRKLKLDAHPLAPVVRQLGFEPMLREPKEGPTPIVVRNFLECYPFISSSAAIDKWPCFVRVNREEMTRDEVKTFFEENLEEIRERSDRYRKDLETDLVLRLLTVWDECDSDRSSEYMVKASVNDSEENTAGLSDVTRLLLRADVVFSRFNINSSSGQGQIAYYPEFLSPNSSFTRYSAYSWNQPPKFSAKAYHPHLEGERTAKAILESIGKPDASYLELAVMGDRFLCERCFMQKPLSWKGLIQHYLDEVSTLDKLVSTRPKFKTRHEIPIYNPHDVNPLEPLDDAPLAVICTTEEANSMRANPGGTPNEQGPEYCLPCKNHGRMYVSNVTEQMHDHLGNVHGVTRITRDVHYGLISDSGTFLEIGGVWKENWDAHYDRIKEGVDDTDTEQEEDFHDDLGILVAQRNQAKAALPVPAPLSMATAASASSPPIPPPFLYDTDSEVNWAPDIDPDDDVSLDGFGA